MSMEKYPRNPIEQRKAAVRKHTRNGVIWVGGGVVGGLALTLLSGGWIWIILGLVIAVAGGLSSYRKVNRIINHKDNY
ncbi:hypothetical protein [Corynebacterium halotolerans]|uniref:hypothetical protein n=1 Tax=Corynebacterium halotolerans TaxID=225326 RepID=UPI003CEDB661